MKRKKIHFYIQYVVFLLMIFSLPLERRLLPPLMLLLSFNWVVEVMSDIIQNLLFRLKIIHVDCINNKWIILKNNRLIFAFCLFCALFVLYVIGLYYTENISIGKNELILKLSLFAMPVILFTSDLKLWNKSLVKWIFNVFILGCFLGIMYCLYQSLSVYRIDHNFGDFFYQDHSFFHHPSYASMFYTFALSAMIYYLINNDVKIHEKIIYILLIPLFIVDIFLLSSRTALLILFFVAVLFIFYVIIHKHNRLLNVLYTLIIFMIAFSVYKFMPEKYNRFFIKFNNIHSVDDLKEDVRFYIWTGAWEASKENIPYGVGTGDAKDILKNKYKDKSLKYFYNREYNAHNQYLQILLTLGIPGMVVFVSGLLYAFIISIKKRYFLYVVFLIIFGLNILTESMLERQAGVVFYAVFNALLCLIAFIPLPESVKENI